MDWHIIVSIFIIVITISNPIPIIPVFLALTNTQTLIEQKKTAFVTGLSIAIILLLATWCGSGILHALGIRMGAFILAGGLILLLIGLAMLTAKTSGILHNDDEHTQAKQKNSVGIVPLAIPIIAGPAAISNIIVKTHIHSSLYALFCISGIAISAGIINWIVFSFSEKIKKILGLLTINIVSRLTGLLLIAFAFTLFAHGLTVLFPHLFN